MDDRATWLGAAEHTQPACRRQAVALAEMAGHVALVGETGGKRGFGQRLAAEHQPAGDVQPALDQVAVGAGAEQRAEIARQAPAFALGDLRQFVEAQRALQA